MGGDGGLSVTLPAAAQALQTNSELQLYLVGDENQIAALLPLFDETSRERLEIVHAPDTILDEDKPSTVLRSSKQTSMYKCVELVKTGAAQAMVSAGNTGALLMIGRHLLKTIPGIHKPAMVATIPAASRQCYLLDVGANPECDAQQLFEFAVMGSVLAESHLHEKARVGLLNIGSEHYKGTIEVQAAAALLKACPAINYVGFVEANALFDGNTDVVVCDGFVGNVTIKCSAGVAKLIKRMLSEQIKKNWLNRVANFFSFALRSQLSQQINPHQFNGASLIGLQGSIIKSHGNATIEGFTYAIAQAVAEVENAVPKLIAQRVAAIVSNSQHNSHYA